MVLSKDLGERAKLEAPKDAKAAAEDVKTSKEKFAEGAKAVEAAKAAVAEAKKEAASAKKASPEQQKKKADPAKLLKKAKLETELAKKE